MQSAIYIVVVRNVMPCFSSIDIKIVLMILCNMWCLILLYGIHAHYSFFITPAIHLKMKDVGSQCCSSSVMIGKASSCEINTSIITTDDT